MPEIPNLPAGTEATCTEEKLPSLGQAASNIAREFRPYNAYPVFGAQGKEFFVEIASGPMNGRTIHWTIYIAFGDTISHDDDIEVLTDQGEDGSILCRGCVSTRIQYPPCFGSKAIVRLTDTEAFARLPDESWLVAFLSLLGAALGTGGQIMHPLNGAGDMLQGWEGALAVVANDGS